MKDASLLDRNGFFERVYAVVRQVPEGRVTTYGAIARTLGTKDARRVGQALHANPYEGDVPCHRVVSMTGGLAPNFAFNGSDEQRRRLLAEGVSFLDEMHVDLKRSGWSMDAVR